MMKRRYIIYIAALLIAVGCDKSGSGEEANVGYSRLSIEASTNPTISMTTTRTEQAKYTIDEALIPTSDELSLTIEGSYIDPESGKTESLTRSYENLDAYNRAEDDCPPMLPAGDYTFTLSDGRETSEESATNPCFSGSTSLTLYAQDYDAEATISVTLQNSIIALDTSDTFDNYFAGGATLKLTTKGGATIDYDSTNYDPETILFVAPSTTLYLEGKGTKQNPTEDVDSAPTVTFAKSEIGTTTKGVLSRVIVDAANAGAGKISITLDDTITDIIYETIELNPIQ